MKGCICHFTKWQIHPFISKGTKWHTPCSIILTEHVTLSVVFDVKYLWYSTRYLLHIIKYHISPLKYDEIIVYHSQQSIHKHSKCCYRPFNFIMNWKHSVIVTNTIAFTCNQNVTIFICKLSLEVRLAILLHNVWKNIVLEEQIKPYIKCIVHCQCSVLKYMRMC